MKDYNFQQLSPVIHSRIRLSIMLILREYGMREFTFIRDSIKTSDGNLSIHLKKLDEAGFVSIRKGFVDNKPITTYELTNKGKRSLEIYITRLNKLLQM